MNKLPEHVRIRVRKAQRDTSYRMKYGLTVETVDQMIEERQGLCDICHKPGVGKMLHVDHNHNPPYTVRGMLCDHCNWMIGHAKESPERLREAALYLERHAA